jgi:hypothetical protein
MLVVADTSPINYLVLLEHEVLLPRLYTRILLPPAVIHERLCQLSRHEGEAGHVERSDPAHAAAMIPIKWVNCSRWMQRRWWSERYWL